MKKTADVTRKILIVCNDHIGATMAGPGIRAWELAHALERRGHAVVVLARGVEIGFTSDRITFTGVSSFFNLITWTHYADSVIQTGRPFSILFSILLRKQLVFDQYDPVIFELLEMKTDSWSKLIWKQGMALLWKIRQRLILRFGDRFLVANEKQRDLLIGQMAILGHSNKLELVSVLPFGLPDVQPMKNRSVLRGTMIKETDFLIVWGGGIWGWFDPFTLLLALAKIAAVRDDIKVYFPGIQPPSPDSKKMAIFGRFLDEARNLKLLDTTVFVNTGWTPYAQRADYLLEADAGVSLHRDSLETRFAFRTRMLDYLWAGLPIIASKGDSWADFIEQRGLGIIVPCGDADLLAQAIIRMADEDNLRSSCSERVAAAADEYRWDFLVERLMLQKKYL